MLAPFRILVAEDDPGDTLLLKRAFERSGSGLYAHFVEDGQKVIDYLKRRTPYEDASLYPAPNLLLLDLKMPRMDGFDVLRWLRRQPKWRDLFVAVFTGSIEAEDVRRAYALAADSVTLKPAEPGEFIEVVRDMERRWLRLNATPECGCVFN